MDTLEDGKKTLEGKTCSLQLNLTDIVEKPVSARSGLNSYIKMLSD